MKWENMSEQWDYTSDENNGQFSYVRVGNHMYSDSQQYSSKPNYHNSLGKQTGR